MYPVCAAAIATYIAGAFYRADEDGARCNAWDNFDKVLYQAFEGNNEKPVSEKEALLRIPGVTKIIFSPFVDANNQLRYTTIP